MSQDDLEFVALMGADAEVMRYFPDTLMRVESTERIERQVRRYADNGLGLWLVELRVTSEPVGQVGLCMQEVDGTREPEIGYHIHSGFWRRGFATESAIATRDYAFNTLGLDRVISLVRPINTPSQGVARKLGMRPERETEFKGLPHIVFSLTAGSRA